MQARIALLSGWRINWLGSVGQGSGVTVEGSTGWRSVGKNKKSNLLVADVHTVASRFGPQPRYFPSLIGTRFVRSNQYQPLSNIVIVYQTGGLHFTPYVAVSTIYGRGQYRCKGVSSVYPTYLAGGGSQQSFVFGFRIYVMYDSGLPSISPGRHPSCLALPHICFFHYSNGGIRFF